MPTIAREKIKLGIAVVSATFALASAALPQSSPDAPAEKKVTVASEISRGASTIASASSPNRNFLDDVDQMLAAISRNKEQNRDTDGFLLGANFRFWVNCDIAYKVGIPNASRKYAELAFHDWQKLEQQIGIDDQKLCELAHTKYELVAPRIALYRSSPLSSDASSSPNQGPPRLATPSVFAPTVVARDPNTIALTKDISVTIPYGVIGIRAGTKFRILSRSGDKVRVRYNGVDCEIPISATDLK
jgi:hypothetical protein